MRLFLFEMKKIWFRLTALAALALGLLTYIAITGPATADYGGDYSTYGKYKEQMFRQYGDTLEPEELADFDISGQLAALHAEAQAIIDNNAVYAKYGVKTIEDISAISPFVALDTDGANWLVSSSSLSITSDDAEIQAFNVDYAEMMGRLYSRDFGAEDSPGAAVAVDGQGIDSMVFVGVSGGVDGPMPRIAQLENLARRYAHLAGGENPAALHSNEHSPRGAVVIKRTQAFLASDANNLINHSLTNNYSTLMAVYSVLAAVITLMLVAPVLVNDRARGLHHIQYAAGVGRGVFRTQCLAALASSALVGTAVAVFGTVVFLMETGAGMYWHTRVADYANSFVMYNPTFGQYVWLLAGLTVLLSVFTGCAAFLLARFSANIVALMIKAVPTAVAMAFAAIFTQQNLLSDAGILFAFILRGGVEFPEFILCGILVFAGVVAACVVTRRERYVDVA